MNLRLGVLTQLVVTNKKCIQKVHNAKIVYFVDTPTPCNTFLLFFNNRRAIDITLSTMTHPPPSVTYFLNDALLTANHLSAGKKYYFFPALKGGTL